MCVFAVRQCVDGMVRHFANAKNKCLISSMLRSTRIRRTHIFGVCKTYIDVSHLWDTTAMQLFRQENKTSSQFTLSTDPMHGIACCCVSVSSTHSLIFIVLHTHGFVCVCVFHARLLKKPILNWRHLDKKIKIMCWTSTTTFISIEIYLRLVIRRNCYHCIIKKYFIRDFFLPFIFVYMNILMDFSQFFPLKFIFSQKSIIQQRFVCNWNVTSFQWFRL